VAHTVAGPGVAYTVVGEGGVYCRMTKYVKIIMFLIRVNTILENLYSKVYKKYFI
jgi:hypothetical protein